VVDHGRIVAQGTAAQLKATIGGTLLRVRLEDAADVQAAVSLLADMSTAEQRRIDTAQGEIRVPVTDPAVSAEAVRRLDEHGLPIAALEVQEPSLDDVFLALTGRPMDEAQPLAKEAV
jgi:ABC-type uncharacterized transport system ATPase subunit